MLEWLVSEAFIVTVINTLNGTQPMLKAIKTSMQLESYTNGVDPNPKILLKVNSKSGPTHSEPENRSELEVKENLYFTQLRKK